MFPNWPAISQIPDTHLMWALAMLDLNSDFDRNIANRFPEYFAQHQTEGPIPLSVLIKCAEIEAKKHRFSSDANVIAGNLVWLGVASQYHLPLITFLKREDDADQDKDPYEWLPTDLEPAIGRSRGTMFSWKDKQIILFEDEEYPPRIHFLPPGVVDFNR